MMRRTFSSAFILATLLAPVVLRSTEAVNLDELLKQSPFGQRPADSASTDPSAAATTLELRGVFTDQGEFFFSIYDTSSRSSRWVGFNETGEAFVVKSYDDVKNEAKVEYQGREITLGLKQAKAAVLVSAPPAVPSGPPIPQISAASLPPAGPVPVDESTYLAQIAEEIRSRRAQRMLKSQNDTHSATAPAPASPP